jgi:hypothetical protein
MIASALALRLSRRAIAAVAVSDEGFAFCDGRHLTSQKNRAIHAAERYVNRVLDLAKPTYVVIDAPVKGQSTTTQLLTLVSQLLTDRHIAHDVRATPDLLDAFGAPAVRSRSELRRITDAFWPELPSAIGRVKPFVLEAAAVSLHANTLRALDPPAP